MRLLLIEDDLSVAESVELILKSVGHVVDVVGLGEEGIELGAQAVYDLIVLEIMLPDMDGYEVLRRLRAAGVETPVLVLTGLSDVEHRVKSLASGADDHMTKPFDRRELVVRVQAVLRRARGGSRPIIRTGRLAIDLDRRSALVDGREMNLTGKEYAVIELMSLRKGVTVSKEMILRHLYDRHDEPEKKIIDVFICKLRKKISAATGGERYIKTLWGRGYVLCDPSGLGREDEPVAVSAA